MVHGRHRARAFALAFLFTAFPLLAQSTDDRIQALQTRLDALLKQAADLQTELNAIRGTAADEQDLTQVGVVTDAAAPAQPPAQPSAQVSAPPSLTEVDVVTNQAAPSASKVFNPDTSVIGNFISKAGSANPFEFGDAGGRAPFQLEEAEIGFEAFVDPYLKGKFFLAAGPEGLEVEEAYAQAINLPYGLTAKAGRMKALFGKANTWHTHSRPWVDQPLMIHNFFGDEQLADSGISVSRILPASFAYIEATGEVYSGDVDNVWGRRNLNDLGYNAHLKLFKDISENSNIEVGTSFARGTLPGATTGRTNQFGGVDVTYRWKPLERGIYKSVIGRFEGLVDQRDDANRRLKGFYASLDYQLAQRWFAGARLDRADRLIFGDEGTHSFTDRGLSGTITFWPSEFSQIRGQLRRTSYGGLRSVNELLLQLQFSIGAHGAHTF